METITATFLVALVWKIVDTIKFAVNRNKAALTQILAWFVAIGVAFLAANAEVASSIQVGGQALSTLSGWSLVLVGLGMGSAGSVLVDMKRSIDSSDSASTPSLFPDKS